MANKSRLKPKHKHEKPSWLKRNKAREVNQQVFETNKLQLQAAHDAIAVLDDHDALASFASEGNPHHD